MLIQSSTLLKICAVIELTLLPIIGRTPLFCAAEEGWHNIIALLIDQDGCIEMTDITGETPLIAATRNGFSQTMKVLLESGAHIFTRDKKG